MSNYQRLQQDTFSTAKGRALVADCEKNIDKCLGNATGAKVIARLCALIPGMSQHAEKLAADAPTQGHMLSVFAACRAVMDDMDGVEWSWDMLVADSVIPGWREQQ